MAVEKIKATMEWKCPYCGLHAKGTITMNSANMTWLESAWDAHVKSCRDKASATRGIQIQGP